MDHPLIKLEQKRLRQRVVDLLKNGYTVRRSSSIVFVCGGNEPLQMRPLFKRYCEENDCEFDIFFPEAAMGHIFSNENQEAFDLADFEELVGELSHAIVIFPEAPGSYAEVGYFCAVEKLAKKTLLVLDADYQGNDSFISMGPAVKYDRLSDFRSCMQFNYHNPVFEQIITRLKRVKIHQNRKSIEFSSFSSLPIYDVAAIISEIVKICSVATTSDIIYIMRALFSGAVSIPQVQKITSILVGAGFLVEYGDFGHVCRNTRKKDLLELREGFLEQRDEIHLSLAAVYMKEPKEFRDLIQGCRDVG